MITHNILICDELPLIGIGMELVIKRKYPYCQIYITDDFSDVLGLLSTLRFDLLFIDICKNGFNEYSILKKIKIIQPDLTLIILTFFDEFDFKNRSFLHGANAILNKTCTEESIHQVVNGFLFGDSLFNNKIKLYLELRPSAEKNKQISNSINTLSTREYELALLLIGGESCKNIANTLKISQSTVSTYKKRILVKTKTTNILQLEKLFINRKNISTVLL